MYLQHVHKCIMNYYGNKTIYQDPKKLMALSTFSRSPILVIHSFLNYALEEPKGKDEPNLFHNKCN